MAESWMDSEGLYDEDLGGGVYFDPKTGKYYADVDYEYKGGRKGLFKGRKTEQGSDFIELTEDQLSEFKAWRDSNEGKRYRGRRGKEAYRGPGTAMYDRGDPGFQRPEVGQMQMYDMYTGQSKRQKEAEAYEDKVRKRVMDYAAWYKSETAGGERGSARMQSLKSKGEATRAMRQRYDKGRGWGSV